MKQGETDQECTSLCSAAADTAFVPMCLESETSQIGLGLVLTERVLSPPAQVLPTELCLFLFDLCFPAYSKRHQETSMPFCLMSYRTQSVRKKENSRKDKRKRKATEEKARGA